MGKIIGFFIPFLVLFYCAGYWFIEYLPTDTEPQSIVVLRITEDDEPFEGAVRWYYQGEDGRERFSWETGKFSCYHFVYDPAATRLEVFRDASGEGAPLFSYDIAKLYSNDRLRIDLDTGRVSQDITFGQYFTGIIPSMGFLFLVQRFFGYGLAAYFFAFLTPLGFLAMVYSIVREAAAGIKRKWAGSWAKMAVGIVVAGLMISMFVTTPPEELSKRMRLDTANRAAQVFMVVFMIGYPLYALASRTFNAEEIRAERERALQEDFATANTFTYTKTYWSDGTTTSNFGTQLVGRNLGMLLIHVLSALLLPLSTYWDMIKYYLVPILDGEASWSIR